MTKGFDAYKTYIALRNHFKNPDYDYFKYNGQVNVKESTFLSRKDRWHFEKVARTYDKNTFRFFLSNFVDDSGFYIGRAMKPQFRAIYDDWVGYMDSSSYRFNSDMNVINEYCDEKNVTFLSLFTCIPNEHPLIYRLSIQDHIHFLTFCILCETSGIIERLDSVLEYDPVWSKDSIKIKKTIPFITIKGEHKQKILQTIKQTEQNSNK